MEHICNICGRVFDICDENEGFSIQKNLGYGTKYDGDGLELHICCNCMEKIIDSCVVSPLYEAYI